MKTKNKKIFSLFSVYASICLILVIVFSTFNTLTAHADTLQGNETTAIKKLYYKTLKSCISNPGFFNNDKLVGGFLGIGADVVMETSDIRNGTWFSSSGFNLTKDENIDQDGVVGVSWSGGAYIENAVTGEYENGKIYCGENENAFIKKAISVLGVSYLDLACDYSSGHANSGIFYSDTSTSYCSDTLQSGSYMYQSTGRDAYLTKVITEKTFGGNVPGGSLDVFTDLEAYYAYYDTFVVACATGSPHFGSNSLVYQVKAYNPSTGEIEQAGFSQKNSPGTKVYTFNGEQITCQQIADKLNEGQYTDSYGDFVETETENGGLIGDIVPGGDSTPSDVVNGGGETDACYSGSGAMGWIICPVTAAVSGVGNWAWEIIEKNFLVIDTNGLFGNSGVNSAWGTIRDIANIAFIIVVLVIIFSQLTGVGIDNYGIKKMLPKIIVAAVLVNLSLIICQLCVEVSNIVGQSVRSWLTNLAPTAGAGMSTGGAVGSGMLGVALGAGGMGLYALLNGTTLGGAFAALGLAVLGIVIVIVFAILVLYIILVIREAGVVLLIIISPIALTCRILPNTEKLYKKWFDLFKAVLVVYPLCSFMVGAGQLAGSILSQLDSSSMKVAAMVVQVVPFILIPSLLKSSLSLMGNIGNKLSGWGRGLGRGAKGGVNRGITNSQGYKRMTDGFNLKKASRYDDRMQKRMRKGKSLSESQQAKLAQARGTILKSRSEEINNRQMSNNDMNDYMRRQQEIKAESDRIKVRSDVLGQESRGKFGKTYTDSTGTHNGFLMAGIESGKIEETLAALDTMESSGYNKEMLDVLMDKDGDIVSHFEAGQQQRIFAKLAGSSDAVLQAYGKEQLKAMDKGETVKSLADFMSGGKGDGVTNTMASYLDAKGNVVLNGQNDDTIKFIMYSDSAKTDVTDRIMTDNDIISVARNPKDNKVTSAIIESLKSRGGLQQEISARQLADIKSMDMFNAMVPTSADIDRVLGTAIKDMANDRSNKLLSSLDPEIRKVIQAKVDAMRSGTASGGSADTTYHPEDE